MKLRCVLALLTFSTGVASADRFLATRRIKISLELACMTEASSVLCMARVRIHKGNA